MKLEDFASDLVAQNHFVKCSFGGFAGAGKSRTAAEFVVGAYKDLGCKAPLLLIDNEGSRWLKPFFERHGIQTKVKDTVELADILTSFELLRQGQIDFLMIDTLTKVWYKYVRDYRQKNRVTFMSLQDWGKILPEWQFVFADAFVGTEGNIVFTGRGGHQYDKEEDETDPNTGRIKKGQFVKSGVKMKLAGETPFEPDLNVWMEQEQEIGPSGLRAWRTAQVLKDRSGVIDGKSFENPTYDAFRPIVRFLLDIPKGAVHGSSSTQNLAPSEDHGAWQRRKDKEIVLEKIQGILVKHYPSQQADDKRAKQALVEKHFRTLSWTEVEQMPMEALVAGYAALAKEFDVKLADPPPDAANAAPGVGDPIDDWKARIDALGANDLEKFDAMIAEANAFMGGQLKTKVKKVIFARMKKLDIEFVDGHCRRKAPDAAELPPVVAG